MTWISGGGAFRAIDDAEWAFEDGREGKQNVETAGLDLAVDGGRAARHCLAIDGGRGHDRRQSCRSDFERERERKRM